MKDELINELKELSKLGVSGAKAGLKAILDGGHADLTSEANLEIYGVSEVADTVCALGSR